MLVKMSRPLPDTFHSVLLIQLGDIGDVVLTMTAIRALRDRFPEARLFVAVRQKARELIDDCPWVDGTIAVEKQNRKTLEAWQYQKRFVESLRKPRFDLAVDLRTGQRGSVIARLSGARIRIARFSERGPWWRNMLFTHIVRPQDERFQYAAEQNLNILSPLRLDVPIRPPRLSIPDRRRTKAREILRNAGLDSDRPVIALHPFSLWAYKECPVPFYVDLIRYLLDRFGYPVIVTGAPEEHGRAEELLRLCPDGLVNLAGACSIGEFPALLEQCRLVVGVDTAALHVGMAVGTPTAGIFGPSPPEVWAPRGREHIVLRAGMPCQPCRDKGCQDTEISRCLTELTLADIRNSLEEHMVGLGL